jgi:hypothetical protein
MNKYFKILMGPNRFYPILFLGAIIYWICTGFKKPFKEAFIGTKKDDDRARDSIAGRNNTIGWIAFFVLLYLLKRLTGNNW